MTLPPRLPRDSAEAPLHGEDVRGLGIDAALEHVEVGVPDRLEALAADDIEPAADPLAERVPGLGDTLLDPGGAPVPRALRAPIGREEERRPRSWKVPAAIAALLPVGYPDDHAAGEPSPVMGVYRAADVARARDGDAGGGL